MAVGTSRKKIINTLYYILRIRNTIFERKWSFIYYYNDLSLSFNLIHPLQ